jgi:AICAR transformylase/IMP cyclohydrolase PurH
MSKRGTDITSFKRKYSTRNVGDFPNKLVLELQKEWDLKYGENPNQQGAIYFLETVDGNNARTLSELTNLVSVRSDSKGKGGLSLTNTMDIGRGMDVLKYFSNQAVVIMKHNVVSGFATENISDIYSMAHLFRSARDADLRSNFGGTVVFNKPIKTDTAIALYELIDKHFFVDVVAAPGYADGVIEFIESKSQNIRMAQFSSLDQLPKFQGDNTHGLISIKELPTGRIGIQDIYLTSIKTADDLTLDPMVIDRDGKEHIIARDPNNAELDDLLTAWWLNISGARSNGVVFVRNGVLVAMGSGQVERVGAVEMAIVKGMQKAMDREGIEYNPLMGVQSYYQLSDNPFLGAVFSSDGFFPFDDSVRTAQSVGVTAAIHPFGSIRDDMVIDAANELKMAMPATLERCFGHF